MAKKVARPGRTLIVFVLAVLVMYVGLAMNGNWAPKLGLDLQGGTRITLQASTGTGEEITPEKLEEAAGIIDSRVNATGVAESEVSTQGRDTIIVEIPGENRKDLVDLVKQTAQLRFRLVAGTASGVGGLEPLPGESPTDGASPSGSPSGSPSTAPKASPSDAPKTEPSGAAERAVSQGLVAADKARLTETPSPDAEPGGAETPATKVPTDESTVQELLAWSRNPDPKSLARFEKFTCEQADEVRDNPATPILACDDAGQKFLLSPAMIEGTELADASYGIPTNDVQYVVNLDFDKDATETFAEVTRAINGTGELFAIVLDGQVLSAPRVTSPILDGNAQITGDFTSDSARSLANSLKYGALPLTFEESVVSEEGPTLAADQLSAGLLAGGIGLGLVVLYCLFYYRGLGLVVVASLGVAAAITYGAVLFLSETAGFTLTLPGIAGLIVGVGITADSFIVYFERIRDEMRDGKSIRVAVEAGWARARNTCVIADMVSLLAAVVLFIFAIGVVKGFAFALGVSTVIDLIVFFFFTKPMVSWLVRFRFFGMGHRLSGLSAAQAGIDHIGAARPAGGIAR